MFSTAASSMSGRRGGRPAAAADRELLVGGDERLGELRPDGLVDNDAARAGATLAGGADGAEDDGALRQLQVGRGVRR